MKKHQEKEKSHKRENLIQFTGKGSIEGRVQIPALEEITIQGARDVLEGKDSNDKVKSYKCKIVGTDTHIIIRRNNFVGSGSKEISLACTDIFRFFIFAKDPRLVILVVPDKPDGSKAYLLLKMQDDKQANQICNVIQMGRKNLLKSPDLRNGSNAKNSKIDNAFTRVYGDSRFADDETEMKENNENFQGTSDSDESTTNEDDAVIMLNNILTNSTEHFFESDLKTKTDSHLKLGDNCINRSTNEILYSKGMSPETESCCSNIITKAFNQIQSSAPSQHFINQLDHNLSPGILPRQPLLDPCRRTAPQTEEMLIESPKFLRSNPLPIYHTKEELRAELLRDLYDKDWAVDLRLVKDVGPLGSRFSETGDVYLFTAHHLVAEPNLSIMCTVGSDEIYPDDKSMQV